jgi:hypothetical protein
VLYEQRFEASTSFFRGDFVLSDQRFEASTRNLRGDFVLSNQRFVASTRNLPTVATMQAAFVWRPSQNLRTPYFFSGWRIYSERATKIFEAIRLALRAISAA